MNPWGWMVLLAWVAGVALMLLLLAAWLRSATPTLRLPPRDPPIGTVEWFEEEVEEPASIQWVEAVAPEGESQGTCQVCGEGMVQNVVRCRRCRTPHHRECWKYIGRCTTFGCGEKRAVEGLPPARKVKRAEPTRIEDWTWLEDRLLPRPVPRNELTDLEQTVLRLASNYSATNVDADGSDNTLGMTFTVEGQRYGLSLSLETGGREAQILTRLDPAPTPQRIGEVRTDRLRSRLRAVVLEDGTLRIRPRGFRWTGEALELFVREGLELVGRLRAATPYSGGSPATA